MDLALFVSRCPCVAVQLPASSRTSSTAPSPRTRSWRRATSRSSGRPAGRCPPSGLAPQCLVH
eukprot:1820175-Alexandrium_andersonii.AAC.1